MKTIAEEKNNDKCDRCGGYLGIDMTRMGNVCRACGLDVRLGDRADADESATDLEERLGLALDAADEDDLDSSTGMTKDERENIG